MRVKLLPDDTGGRPNPELAHEAPLDELPLGEDIQAGGNLVAFRVTAIENGIVHLDGNNPLAGQTLIFEVEIQGIRAATETEIQTGNGMG